MTMVYIQLGMVMGFGALLMTAMRLRNNGKTLSVASVVEQVQQVLDPASMVMTKEQRRAMKKARHNTRRIGWAGRRLLSYFTICKFKTKNSAFSHLKKMSKSAKPGDKTKVESILERLARGEGDTRFQTKAMELLAVTNPRRALKLRVELNKRPSAEIVEMPYRQPAVAMAAAA